MPFISGQASGLIAGITIVVLYSLIYMVMKFYRSNKDKIIADRGEEIKSYHGKFATEFSKELTEETNEKDKIKVIKKRGYLK